MEEDAGVGDEEQTEGHYSGLWLAITDWKVWWLAFTLTSQAVALSFNAYFPTLSATLGFNPTVTLLLCAPPFVFTAIFAFVLSRWVVRCAWVLSHSEDGCRHSDKTGERFFHIVGSLGAGILGFIISIATMNIAARYISLWVICINVELGAEQRANARFLMAQSYAGFVVLYAWISNSFPRPPSKRTVAVALINAFSQLGNVAGS